MAIKVNRREGNIDTGTGMVKPRQEPEVFGTPHDPEPTGAAQSQLVREVVDLTHTQGPTGAASKIGVVTHVEGAVIVDAANDVESSPKTSKRRTARK